MPHAPAAQQCPCYARRASPWVAFARACWRRDNATLAPRRTPHVALRLRVCERIAAAPVLLQPCAVPCPAGLYLTPIAGRTRATPVRPRRGRPGRSAAVSCLSDPPLPAARNDASTLPSGPAAAADLNIETLPSHTPATPHPATDRPPPQPDARGLLIGPRHLSVYCCCPSAPSAPPATLLATTSSSSPPRTPWSPPPPP